MIVRKIRSNCMDSYEKNEKKSKNDMGQKTQNRFGYLSQILVIRF